MATVTIEQALPIALAHHRAGKFAEAEAIYRQILAREPTHAGALHGLGLIALTTGRHAEALQLISRAIFQAPAEAGYHCDLGLTCHLLGRLEEAAACYRRALELQPGFPEAHLNLGDALAGLARLDEAIASHRRALQLRPDFAEAHNNLGTVLTKMGQREEALACFQRALALKPDYAEAHSNLGDALLEMGHVGEAIASCQRALALKPQFAEGHASLGAALLRQGGFEEAIASYRQAIACRADFASAHWKLAFILLLLGRYEEGWKELEWRWWSPALAIPRERFSAPRWNGAPAPGQTILIHAEQGYGDTIQFLRYVPLVRERAGARRVILMCAAPLAPLFAQTGGWNAEIVARERWDEAPLPHFDQHLPLLSLPLALGLLDPLTTAGPYLHADRMLCAAWRERLGATPAFRVGLAWSGTPTHEDDRRRSIDAEKFLCILRVSGVRFYSLQVEPARNQRTPLAEAGLIDLTERLTDFAEAAALMAGLDLIITVDTATAHLAGALGRPVWTLLPFVPDWRWGLEREDTPWYPTMRLFRQPAAGDWDAVLHRVADELTRGHPKSDRDATSPSA